MPSPHNKAKMTGDTHLPDVESELPLQQGGTGVGADGTPRGRASEGDEEDRPGRGIPKAGVLRKPDGDAPSGADTPGRTGASGRKQK